ncbi:nickel-dependent hydrogenase large subunit [Thermodesulfovibrionales bacterium]|nr:nickel-dependent hydrogenase large subunit [Thermodesulfovibrionales bacterium]
MAKIVQIGPFHPLLHEPEVFKLFVESEKVVDVEIEHGFVHRGIELLAQKKTYYQNLFLFERLCGICCEAQMTVFAQAVEAIADIEIPDRARYIRTVVLELERIHSHLLFLGISFHAVGLDALFMRTFARREAVMDLCELITGNRKTYGMITIGGVRRDISRDAGKKAIKTLDEIWQYAEELKGIVEDDPTIKTRTLGKSILSNEEARRLGVVGPLARGSGISQDIRKDNPYAAYKETGVGVIALSPGDTFTRIMVRILEIIEAIKIINRALEAMPSGSMTVSVNEIPSGEATARVEAPRGELLYYVKSNGSLMPERVKLRAPSHANFLAVKALMVGNLVPDALVGFLSKDPCFSCTDRMVIIDVKKGQRRPLDTEMLRRR